MFGYAVKHHALKADMDIKNNANLTPLTMASKLGRNDIFKEIIELQSNVSNCWQSLKPFRNGGGSVVEDLNLLII